MNFRVNLDGFADSKSKTKKVKFLWLIPQLLEVAYLALHMMVHVWSIWTTITTILAVVYSVAFCTLNSTLNFRRCHPMPEGLIATPYSPKSELFLQMCYYCEVFQLKKE